MKTKPIRSIIAALCLGICSCASHSAYYNTISRNLDKARADGKISEANYFKSRMQLEAMEDQRRQQRNAQVIAAMSGVAANSNAQLQATQAHTQAMQDALLLQGVRNATAQPRTYDSTVTPTYPGGPVQVHTEQTGGN